MATEIEIDTVINTDRSDQSLRQLNKGLKELVGLQSQVASGSDQFKKLQKAINDTEGKIGDLNDGFQTLRGSGVERVNSSLGLLREGFSNIDTEKISIGFKGIGSAMKAIPLLLIVEGITFLVEKFGIFGKVAEFVTGIVNGFTDALGFTNIALEKQTQSLIENYAKQSQIVSSRYDAEIQFANATGKRTADLELSKLQNIESSIKSQVESLTKLEETKKELNKEEKKQFDQLQSDLLKATSDRIAKQGALNKEFLDLNKKAVTDLRSATLSGSALEISNIKTARDEQLKALDEVSNSVVDSESEYKRMQETRLAITRKASVEIGKIVDAETEKLKEAGYKRGEEFNRLLGLKQEYEEAVNASRIADAQAASDKEVAIVKKQIDDERNFKLAFQSQERESDKQSAEQNEAQRRLNSENRLAYNASFQEKNLEQQVLFIEQERDLALTNEQLTQRQRIALIEKAEDDIFALKVKRANDYATIAEQGIMGIQAISDIAFEINSARLKKGSKEEEDAARKKFNINKGLQIANAAIQGAQAVLAAFSSGAAIPVAGVIAGPAFAAVAAGVAIANIAKIANTQYKSSASGGSDSASGSVPEIPTSISPSSTPSFNQNSFNPTGQANAQTNSNAVEPVKVYVLESDIRNVTGKVNVIESRATFP